MTRRATGVLLLGLLTLAACERSAPLEPAPPDRSTPLEPYGPVGPDRPYGTDPSLGALSVECPGRCAVVLEPLAGTYPQDLNDAAQVLARDGAGTLVWSREQGTVRPALAAGARGAFLTDWGIVVGGGEAGSGVPAFVWTPWSGTRPIGTLGGASAWGTGSSDDGSRVVGRSEASGGSGWHAFLWSDDSGMRALAAGTGWSRSEAAAMNDAGQVAGWGITADGERAVVWSAAGQPSVLPAPAGAAGARAVAINRAGWVIGNTHGGGSTLGWVWSGEHGIRELGTLGGPRSEARGINAWGEVVGASTTATGELHGFVWREGSMIRLDALGRARSEAIAINSWGDILGWVSNADGSDPQPVVWTWADNASRYGSPSTAPPPPPPPPDAAAITITFDDGWLTTYTHAFPILREKGLRANVGVITSSVDHWNGFLGLAHLRELEEAGWAMVSHSVTHPRLRSVPAEQLERELRDSQQWLRDRGFRISDVFIVPYHEWEDREKAAVKRHYGAARGYTSTWFWPEHHERWPPDDPHLLTSVEPEYYAGTFRTPRGREALRRKLESVVANGHFIDVFFHRIDAEDETAFRETAAILAEYRDYVRTYHDLFPGQ